MAHRRSAGVSILALAALHHPARRAARVCALYGAADAGRLALGVVLTIALLAGHGIAREAVAVTLARPAHVSKVLRSPEVASHAFAALVAPRVVAAIDAFGLRHRSFAQLPAQLLHRHLVHRDRIGHGHAVVDADPRVPVAIFEARHALAVVRGIADVQRQAFLALVPHRVVVALGAIVELVRAGTVAVAIALALDGAVGADVTEVTTAQVGLHARASHAALCAHGHAELLTEVVPPAGLALVPVPAFALEALLQVETLFALRHTCVVAVLALVLRWAADVVPRELRLRYRDVSIEQRHRNVVLRFRGVHVVRMQSCGGDRRLNLREVLMIEHLAGTARRMIRRRFERSLSAYSLTGSVGRIQGTPAAMRVLQARAALLEHRARLRTVIHVRATQHQTADTAGAVERLVRRGDALVQLRGPPTFAPATFGPGTLQTAPAVFVLGAPFLTLRAAQLDAGPLEDVA